MDKSLMGESGESLGTGRNFNKVDGWIVLVLCVLLMGFFWFRAGVRDGLDRADSLELIAILRRWVEAGRPEGESLQKLMQGRRPDMVVTNRTFIIEGTNFVSQFAVTNAKSGRNGAFFVTTNEVLIWVSASGEPEIFRMRRN